ncbi:MAG TPA: shikimate dehydrogenase [Gemmatimonadaceae bacterium]|nr:shikimate dehydrogenase [Gemmatimonadaceae bacterium]
MTATPGRLVLLGHPVHHSLSPRFQNAALRALGVPLCYEALDVYPGALPQTVLSLVAGRAAGNVTVPHKPAFAALCDRRTPLAERVGAVNTFWVAEDGVLVGDNTDVGGFAALAREAHGTLPRSCHVAVLGAGGAAAAVLAAIEQWEDTCVTLANRTRDRAERLAARFPVVTHIAGSAEYAVRDAAIVVNATTVGAFDDALPVPIDALRSGTVVLDLVYRPGGSPWVRAAAQHGLTARDGLSMLIEQGALAFERWLGVEAPRAVMREAVA